MDWPISYKATLYIAMNLPLLLPVSDLFCWLKIEVVEMGRWQICPLLLRFSWWENPMKQMLICKLKLVVLEHKQMPFLIKIKVQICKLNSCLGINIQVWQPLMMPSLAAAPLQTVQI